MQCYLGKVNKSIPLERINPVVQFLGKLKPDGSGIRKQRKPRLIPIEGSRDPGNYLDVLMDLVGHGLIPYVPGNFWLTLPNSQPSIDFIMVY